MQLVLDTNGIQVTKRNNCFLLQTKAAKRMISPKRISSIAVHAVCRFCTTALQLAVDHNIPVWFFSKAGKPSFGLWTASFPGIANLRRKQVLSNGSEEIKKWLIHIARLKIDGFTNIIKLIAKNREKTDLLEEWNETTKQTFDMSSLMEKDAENMKASLRGIEGYISAIYWKFLVAEFGNEYNFKGRSRRPATDRFNALLNYLYGMMYSKVEYALFSAGLDPYLGFMHADEYKKPVLSYDMMDAFRPWADEFLINWCLFNNLEEQQFVVEKNGIFLGKKGKHLFIPMFNDYLDEKIIWQSECKKRTNHIIAEAFGLASRIRNFGSKEEEPCI